MKPSFLSYTAIVCCTFSSLFVSGQVASRLVAQASTAVNSAYSVSEIDSSVFTYSAGRGSDLSTTHFFGIATGRMFDSLVSYSSISGGPFTKQGLMLQYFKGKYVTRVLDMNANSSGGFDNYMSASLLYDTHNNPIEYNDSIYSSSAWMNNTASINTFDAADNMITSSRQTWNGSAWVNSGKDSMAYDAAKDLIFTAYYNWESLKKKWQPREYSTSTYNASKLMTSQLIQNVDTVGVARNSNQYLYTYDTHGRMLSSLFQNWSRATSSWLTYYKDTTIYNAAGDTSTLLTTIYTDPSGPIFHARSIVATDAHGNTIYTLKQEYDSVKGDYVDLGRNLYTYNSFDQMLSNTSEIPNGTGSWMPDTFAFYQYRFYYENYTPTSVSSLSVAMGSLNVYPNPATEMLNIHMTWNEPQAFTVAIYNMQGRLLRQWSEPKTSVYQKQIPVSMFSAGNYIISIKGEHGQLQKQLSIVH